MPSLSDDATVALFNHISGTTAWTMPSEVWLGLATAEPLDDGSDFFEELTANRVDTTGLWEVVTAPPVTLRLNAALLTDPLPAATWSWQFLADAPTGGTLLLKTLIKDALGDPAPITTVAGESLSLPVYSLQFTGTSS